MSIRTTDEDPMNPFAYAWGATSGWRPFEQRSLMSERTLHPVKGKKLSEKTNVWGIVRVNASLLIKAH